MLHAGPTIRSRGSRLAAGCEMMGTEVTLYKTFSRLACPRGLCYFETEAPEPDRMNYVQLRAYIDELKSSGYTVAEHEVELQRKLAFPLVTLVMTLIAVPFAVTTGKRGAMDGIGVGIVLALVLDRHQHLRRIRRQRIDAADAKPPGRPLGATARVLLLTVRT